MAATATVHNGAKMPASLDVVSTAHYESGPPASKYKDSYLDGDVFETVKEEAWEEKKVKTTKKTKNIERRVQRQLVLEDGEVKEDSGPVVTEDCTEDTVTNEVVSNENQRPQGQIEGPEPPGEGWVAIPGSVEVSEKCTKTVNSHEEVEDELETEEIQHCGDVTNKEAEDHVQGKSDLRSLVAHRKSEGSQVALPQKRVVHEATRRRGNIDTVDVKETSRIQDGHVVTETERTVCKEEYDNESAPDSGSSISDGSAHETKKETSHNLVHTKDEDLLEYYAVPRGGTLAQGVKIGEGMHVVSEDVHEDRQGGEVESLDERYKREGRKPFKSREGFRERTDALTKKPLNYQQEEKTRKTETNRWLEAHFGSESGRSTTSSVDGSTEGGRHSAGGNRITITMSPRPATPEDVVDNPIAPIRRSYDKPNSFGAKIPPPPPPKPERVWTPSISPTSPPPHQPREIHESELTAARARLRSTGRSLTDENKENNYPSSESPPQSPFDREPASYNSRINSSVNVTQYNKEPVFSSRYRSGHPENEKRPTEIKKYIIERNSYSRRSPSPSPSPPRVNHSPSPPPVKIATTPLSSSNVGRSQSFHITTLPWFSKKKSENKHEVHTSTLKDYKSEEKLDNVDKRPFSNTRRKLFERFSNFTNKEVTPPPPPRQPKRNDSFLSNSAREVSTQTSPTPVPPPRTKRKKKPSSSYFFGQEDPTPSYRSRRHPNSILTNGYEERSSYSSHNNSRNGRNSYESRTSPKVERRYRTTKTITPVVVMPISSSRDRYREQDIPKSSWTNTVDPRRRPRVNYEDDRSTSTTLPRKLQNNYSSYPRKQYFFGENDSSSDSYSNRRENSHNNRNYNSYNSERNNPSTYNTLPIDRSSKHVGRSQSFNYQAGNNNNNYSNQKDRHNLSNISTQKTSSVYRSSPYLNLRSPNLIASINKTPSMEKANSVDHLNSPKREVRSEETKTRFMEGLLNTAPELFHFIHGEGTDKQDTQNRRSDETNSKLNTRLSSDLNSPNSPNGYKSKVFTFGKGTGSSSLSNLEERYNPEDRRNNENNRYNSENIRNSHDNDYNQNSLNRRTAFNLKTSGRSMLYSPAFRERINSDEMYNSRHSLNGSDKYNRREHSSRY